MLTMPVSNSFTVTYVIQMLYDQCIQRKEQAKQTILMSEKMVRGPPEKDPQL